MCKPCNMYFNERDLLDKHMRAIHSPKVEVSNKTAPSAKTKSILERLRERAGGYCKSESGVYTCNYCYYQASTKNGVTGHVDNTHKVVHQNLLAEMRAAHESQVFEPKPKRVYIRREPVLKELTSSQFTHMYSCPNCDFETAERGEMNNHIIEKHDAKWYDEEAQKTAQDEEKKLRQRLTNGKHECHYCGFKADNRKELQVHTRRVHPGYMQPPKPKSTIITEYKCDQCEYVSLDRQKIKVHIERRHVTELRYTCEYCGKKYKVKCDLTSHIRFQHFKTPTVCDVCGKVCSNSNSLHIHQKRKHFKPDFACHLCSRRMVSQENLDEHILRQHTHKVKYMCDQCGKQFDQPNKLRQHERTHTGEKPHTCHICTKSFARRAVFRQHLLIHTGERPYVCDICGKAFTQKPGLICHRKSHPGPKPPLPTVYIDHILTKFVMETERKEEVVDLPFEGIDEEDVAEMMEEDEEE